MSTVHQYAYEPVQDFREEIREERAAVTSSSPMVLAVVACVMLVFVALAGLIYIKYSVTAMQVRINETQEAIEAIRSEALRLEAKIHSQSSVTLIRDRAEELGMTYPDADHVIRVDLGQAAAQHTEAVTMKGQNP